MSNNIKESIWLIGPGNIGRDYVKVLEEFDLDVTVIGRSKKDNFPLPVYDKGVESYLKFRLPDIPKYSIVAVNESELYNTTKTDKIKFLKKLGLEPFSKKFNVQYFKKFILKNKVDYLLVTAPENVAWILNIRGYDSEF